MPHVAADRVLETTTTTGTGTLTLAGAVAGFRAFSAVASQNDTCWYFLEAVDANGLPTGEWEVGLGTVGAGTLARTAVLASSNAGAAVSLAAGTKYVGIGPLATRTLQLNNELATVLPAVPATPVAAAADTLKLYADKRAGLVLPRFIGPSGVDQFVQPQLWANRAMFWGAGSGTSMSSWGLTPTTAATLSHPALATATLAESLSRTRFATSTTAGNASGARDPVATLWRGNSTGRGGFLCHFRFCTGSISLAGGQKIVGLSSSVAALAGEPSALADVLGVGKDTADTNWQFMRRTGTGTVQKVSLGIAVANNVALDLILYCPPAGSSINVLVRRLEYGGTETTLLDTAYTTDIPAATTFLARHCQVRNGVTAAADNLELASSFVLSDR